MSNFFKSSQVILLLRNSIYDPDNYEEGGAIKQVTYSFEFYLPLLDELNIYKNIIFDYKAETLSSDH